LLEIGDLPFNTANMKPTRQEALEYYRNVAQHYRLNVHQYEWVKAVNGEDGDFRVSTTHRGGKISDYRTRKIIVSTGYYDLPNYMNVPGEDLPKVFHYYHEPHPYYDSDVLVVGGKNSAAIAALELWRHGARVTLAYRGPGMHAHVKYWIKPDIENRIKNGEVTAFFSSNVVEIQPESVLLSTPDGERRIHNDFVFALTGYHPDHDFLQSLGIELSSEQCRPVCDPETLESNVPGIYVAGVIVAGSRTNEIFIENGRFHGHLIAADLKQKLGAGAK
jgi:thioredoxin reductase (NADPH)